jgi:hypothetical protein
MTIHDNGGISLGALLNPGIGNLAAKKLVPGYTATTAAAGTTVLTASANFYQNLQGTTTQTFHLPDATTLLVGTTFIFDNDSSGILTLVDNASGPIDIIPSGGMNYLYLTNNSTVAGSWRKHAFIPASYDFNNSIASFGNATITNATWNGHTIGTAYGGTGLTTFTSGGALYATSTSSLTSGVLPVASGGTGNSSYTDGQLLIGNSTGNTLTKASLTAGAGISITPGSGSISIASTITSGVTITNDTSTATALYPTFTSATSGSVAGLNVTSTKFTFVPSTGTFTVPNVEASNGMIVNSNTVSTSYSIPVGSSALAAGPITVSGGATVTIPSGSRWVVL